MSTKERERRYTPGTVELRASAEDGARTLGGYAIRWWKLSSNLGGFVERVASGAADKSLADGVDVLCRFQHEDHYLLGRVAAGTHRLRADDTGLDYEVDLPDTQTGRDVGVLAGRGDLRHSSFAFFVPQGGDEWGLSDQEFPLRTLLGIGLRDTAPVVEPAYPDTSTGLRSLADHKDADLAEVQELARHNKLAILLAPNRHRTTVDLAPAGARADTTPADTAEATDEDDTTTTDTGDSTGAVEDEKNAGPKNTSTPEGEPAGEADPDGDDATDHMDDDGTGDDDTDTTKTQGEPVKDAPRATTALDARRRRARLRDRELAAADLG